MQGLRVVGGLREPSDALEMHPLAADVRPHDRCQAPSPEEMAADGSEERRISALTVPSGQQVLACYVVLPLPLPHLAHEVLPSAALYPHLLAQSAPMLPDELEQQLPHVLCHVFGLLLGRLRPVLLEVAVGLLVSALGRAAK